MIFEKEMKKFPCVYIVGNDRNAVLYICVTSNLPKRIWEHKNNVFEGFTQKYNCKKLYYYETHETMESAIAREKKLKTWNRVWKIALIEEKNPEWKDLWEEVADGLW